MSARAPGALRLVVLHPTFESWGGAEWFAHALAQGLARDRGASVTVLTHRYERAWSEDRDYRVIEHREGGYLAGPDDWRRVARRFGASVREHDAVLVHNWPATEWLRAMHDDAPVPRAVWYCHEPPRALFDDTARVPGQEPRAATASFARGLRFYGVRLPLALLRRRRAARLLADPAARQALARSHRDTARLFARVAANSANTAARVRALYGLEAQVVYPIARDLVTTPRVEAHPASDVLLWVGRMTQEKRPLETVRAWRRVARDGGARLVMVGDGPLRAEVEREAGAAGLGIALLRDLSRDALRARYRAALATLFTAEAEPLGLVPLESMAEGTPVIAHDDGGPTETVVDGETGWLQPLVTEDAIASGIARALRDRAALAAMRAACVAHVRLRFSPDRTFDQVMALLLGATISS